MDYRQAVKYIEEIPKFSGKSSPRDTKLFLEQLGHPDRRLNIIHVAGTNGKGSVCAFLESILRSAGYRTGMFTSPHLVTMRERISIGGQMVSEETFVRAFEQVRAELGNLDPRLAEKGYHPSFFEYLFFMGLLIFEQEMPDYCILETGLGGRLDATNCVAKKLACVITSISYDHTQYLGNTLEEIAGEKAGIILENVPVVYPVYEDADGEKAKTTRGVEEQIKKRNAVSFGVSKKQIKDLRKSAAGIDFCFDSLYYRNTRVSVGLCGLYQAENAALAIRCIEALGGTKLVSEEELLCGLAKMRWEARMEQIMPGLILDGAHNPDGVAAFLESVRADGCSKRELLFSMVSDKDHENVIRQVAESGLFDRILILKLRSERGLAPALIMQQLEAAGCRTEIYEDLCEVPESFWNVSTDDGHMHYIAGSLYLAGEVKTFLADRYRN